MNTLQLQEISTGKQNNRSRAKSLVLIFLYLIFIGSISRHLYREPAYSMDSIQYMGDALLMEDTDVVRIHAKVYSELNQWVPQPARDHLLGREAGAPQDQNDSRQARANNPYRFGEFLPFFAIRPLYNAVLFFVSKTGLGLVRATAFISAAAYFFLGTLLFVWIRKYVGLPFAVAIASLTMICPPVMTLGRETTSDALATLVAFSSLYLIFEKRLLMAGLIVLLGSIYFRTDFVVLTGPVLVACWFEKRLNLWQAGVLAALALGSVLSINHFAGDYGIKMLYYRNFVGTPVAPGEMIVQFTVRDYISAFRSGITLVASSFFLPFLVTGLGGVFSSLRGRAIATVTIAYSVLHFIVLPNWDERWFGVFYLSMGLAAAAGFGNRNRSSDSLLRTNMPEPLVHRLAANA